MQRKDTSFSAGSQPTKVLHESYENLAFYCPKATSVAFSLFWKLREDLSELIETAERFY